MYYFHLGGWTVFLKRQDGSVDFNQNWNTYKNGFGNLDGGEFWLGNELLATMTASSRGAYDLRVDLTDFDGDTAYQTYESFRIDPESQDYEINFGISLNCIYI